GEEEEKMLSMMCRRSYHQQQHDGKEARQRDAASRWHGWSKSCRGCMKGRRTRGGGRLRGRNHRHQHPQRYHPHYHHPRHLQIPVLSLRPINVKGNTARGMRAPKNTNQFLMHEKYQMLHMRSDSVGSDSGSDVELTDMDSYLGVLENARGALLDSPNPHGSTSPPGQIVEPHKDSLRLQEDSMQYFPSEDDLLQTQNFMQRDFIEFLRSLTHPPIHTHTL
uniref:Uncharacterized protein n=1 Tax=Monopterus albus TaxID=43700 RepID=A0A3Q3KEZ1_MONAL